MRTEFLNTINRAKESAKALSSVRDLLISLDAGKHLVHYYHKWVVEKGINGEGEASFNVYRDDIGLDDGCFTTSDWVEVVMIIAELKEGGIYPSFN